MRKLKIQDAELMKIVLQQEIVRSEELFGHSPRTIEYWIERFEQSGFSDLVDQERKGRPTAPGTSGGPMGTPLSC